MERYQQSAGRFNVARGQPAKLLEAAEKAFEFVAVPVQIPVNHPLNETVFFAGNHGLGTKGGYLGQNRVRAVGFVGQHVASPFSGREQVGHAPAIGLLAGAEQQAQRVAQRIDPGVNLGRQPAATPAEGFVADAVFFRLPAAWTCARTTVESSITQSTSGS